MHPSTLFNIILSFLSVVFPFMALSAQELQITEATAVIEPMTVPMQRLDYNNQICALVKVVLPLTDVKFEGNVVGEPVFKTSEYWVYLTPGTKMLKIKAPGYYPVMADFPALGLGPLESKVIYCLTLKTAGVALSQPVVTANFAILTVDPPTAMVEIDGQPKQIEDSSVVVKLKLGQHTWQAKAAGYASASGAFQVTAGEKANVSIKLRSLQKQTAATPAATTASAASGSYSTTPINLALCVELNGQTVYITQPQWKAMSSAERAACRNKWLYVSGTDENENKHSFLLALNDSGKEEMKWDKAMSVYGNSLPTKAQGEVMAKNYEAINIAIKAFDGDKDPAWEYWTRTKEGSSTAWYVSLNYGYVTNYGKNIKNRVRAVAPVTLSSSLQMQADATPAETSISSASSVYSTTPIYLSLCAELNGRTVYITRPQWKAMSSAERAVCKNKWLYVSGYDKKRNKHSFLLALNDSGKGMTWDEAMSAYGNSLPTVEQGEVMANNYDAINRAIKAFGGDEDPEWFYWTKTEFNSSYAWNVRMIGGSVTNFIKTITYRVREVAPVTLSGSLQKQPAATPAETCIPVASGAYSTTPINLTLCAKLNGCMVYITQSQWKAMSSAEQTACKNKWLYVTGNDESGNKHSFLIALNDSGKKMTWNEAMSAYDNLLPTKAQGEVIAKNYEAINIAITAFGGDEDPANWYWTRTECNSSDAWYVTMGKGFVSRSLKAYAYRVRAVAPVPETM